MASGTASGEEIAAPHLLIEHSRMLNGIQPYIVSGNAALTTAYGTTVPPWSSYSGANAGMNIKDEIDAIAGESFTGINPYIGVNAYNPHPHLDRVDQRYDIFKDIVDDMDTRNDLSKATDHAVKLVDEKLFTPSDIDTAVAAHEARTEAGYQRRVSAALAPLLSGRAVMSSGFDDVAVSMALQREDEMDEYAAQLGLHFHDRRFEVAYNLVTAYMSMQQLRVTASQAAVQMRADLARQRILAGQDQINVDLTYDEKQNFYRADLFHYENEVMTSYRGAVTVPRPQGSGERLLGSLGTAATIGISLGTVTKSLPIGLAGGAIAAVLGGVLGNLN